MMPGDVLSSSPVVSTFIGSRALPISKLVDYEDGGIAIQDPSKGLLYQRWTALLFRPGEPDSYVTLSARDVPEFVLLELPGLTEISISFDQNMRPCLAYIQDGVSKLYWFDSSAGMMVVTEIGAGIVTPRVTMDDKRYVGSDGYRLNDIILAYVRAGTLYFRKQRERFTIERPLKSGVNPLIKIGFTRGLRLQFMHEV
jgi:hypothetical protein